MPSVTRFVNVARLATVGALVGAGLFVAVAPARAGGTTSVACGNNTALAAAITNANANTDADTIEITGAPCTFSLTAPAASNAARNNTGLPIVTTPITINGNGATIERNASATVPFRLLFANGAAASLTLHNLTIKSGLLDSGNVGAGIATFGGAALSLDRVTVTSNAVSGVNTGGVAANGAGLWTSGGTLNVDHSTFVFNSAHVAGAMALNLTNGTVRRSLFFLNGTTNWAGGTGSAGVAWIQGGTVNFENDTFGANIANNGIGGIVVSNLATNAGVANVASSTFVDNGRTGNTAPGSALVRFANGANPGPVAINVTDTIVTDSDSTAPATAAPCVGVTNGGANIEWPGSACGFANTADPKLTAVAANGGPTSTYRPAFDSPVIDLAGSTCPATDQRDIARPDGEACDTGAYETPAPDTVATGPAGTTNSAQITFSSPDTPNATFQCSIDGGAYAACTSPYSPTLANGSHTVAVRAVTPSVFYYDRSPAVVSFTIDSAAPTVTITSPAAGPSADNTPTITFTVDDPEAAVTCHVDTGTPEPCSSPYTTPTLTDGSHTITVTATDAAGNTGSAARVVVIDTAPSQTFDVACGDVAALRAAITSANATLAHDTIEVSAAACTFTLTDSVNAAAGGTGLPLVVHPLTVEGHGATIARSTAADTPNFRIWFVVGTSDPASTLTLRDLTVLGGSLVNGNDGAGVASFLGGIVLDGVRIQQNVASGPGATGGGVSTVGGSLTVDDSAFYFNQAPAGAALTTILTPGTVRGSTFYLNGGGVTASGATAWVQGETVTFENDTIAANVASNGIGGIIASNSGDTDGRVNVVSSTLFAQRKTGAVAPAGHLFTFQQAGAGTASIHVTDSIVSDTAAGTPALAACTGAVVNDGGNIEWPGTSCGFDTNADPRLDGAIALNGGPTFNYRLLPTSPAIDLGGASCPAVDQRGVARPDGDSCDAGSYEAPMPETFADGPGDTPTNDPVVTFDSPDTPSATFECSIDGEPFAVCSSPFSPKLSDGSHTIAVRAVDGAGYVDRSPAVVSLTVDTTAPVVTITAAPASPTADATPSVEFTVDDTDAVVTCQVDGGAPIACSSPFTTESLAEGMHTIAVFAEDAAGNEGSDSVNLGVSFGPPDTVIDRGPSGTIYNQASSTFTFHSTKSNSTFECRLDGAPFAPCSSPHTVSYSQGSHTFEVRAIDAGGAVDPTPAARSFTYKQCTVRVAVRPFGAPTTVCL